MFEIVDWVCGFYLQSIQQLPYKLCWWHCIIEHLIRKNQTLSSQQRPNLHLEPVFIYPSFDVKDIKVAQQLSTRRDINIGRQGPNNLIKARYHLIKNNCISQLFVYIIFAEMPWNISKLFWPDLEFLSGHIFCHIKFSVHFHTPSWDRNQPHSCHILLLLQ